VKVKSNRWYKNLYFTWLLMSLIALGHNISPAQSQIIQFNETLTLDEESSGVMDLVQFPDQTPINTDDLIDSSCIGRRNQEETGSFIITGDDSLPTTPSLTDDSVYPTGSVQTISSPNFDDSNNPPWKKR
jgi:hypothetical protein